MSAAAPVPHIYTLTGNLLAERTLEFPSWSPGGTYRATRESFQVGGKGVNVSKMLTRLGLANTTLCFAGGSTGQECERWLTARGFNVRAFPMPAPTRIGAVIRAPGQPETTFLGPDVSPDPLAIRSCADYLDEQTGGGVLAVCGSFPGWNEPRFDPLRDALARWLSRGCLVADTYGPPLRWLAQQPLDLVKVNADELRSVEGDVPVEIAALRTVVTDGPRPVRVREGISPEVLLVPPAVKEVSATGSGDVLLACVLDALFRQRKSLRDAVAFALPYAAANAAHAAIAEFPDPS